MHDTSFGESQREFRLKKYYVFETQADTRVLVRCDVRSDSTSFIAAPLTRRTVM